MSVDPLGIGRALSAVVRDSLKLRGRASRGVFIRGFGCYAVLFFCGLATQSTHVDASQALIVANAICGYLITLGGIPMTTLTVRRLRDAGHSQAWVWISWIVAIITAWTILRADLASFHGAPSVSLWRLRMMIGVASWLVFAITTIVLALRESVPAEVPA